ncbi:F-box only protein 40-like [Aplochiton taeniatus]
MPSGRSRPSRARLHLHCESCFSRRCRAPVEVAVSCVLTPCRLLCGAVFHLCKEEEHALLCPNEKVPCLNAQFGCPITMLRSRQASHLEECPASLVCCSMEWNRWPAEDAQNDTHVELRDNLLNEDLKESGEALSLDLAMALRDQNHLFHSLKMKKLFPELIQKVDEEEEERNSLTWLGPLPEALGVQEVAEEEEPEPTQEEREAIARGAGGVDRELLQNYSAWERMFNMEMGGCRQAGEVAARAGVKGQANGTPQEVGPETPTCSNTEPGGASSLWCGSAPSSTSVSCCQSNGGGPKKMKKFVYGHLEPMKIVTVRTFKVPFSFRAKQGRIRNPNFYQREERAVDTSDLGVAQEDMPFWEEVQASLLCSLEKELRGHLIAESLSVDALLQDVGTQTYNFLSAPFERQASLADFMVDRQPELHLQLQAESVNTRHHKASSAFTFLCGHTLQRREFPKHFRNVHSDIQTCVSGWFEQRCPLAYLGCTYSQRRLQPSTHTATVTYNQELSSFNLRPILPVCLEDQPPQSSSAPGEPHTSQGMGGRRAPGRGGEPGGREVSLSALPYEVLCHLASFLDSLSLSQLALVSRLMREVCSSLLQTRGMVSLHWDRSTSSHGGARWRVKQKVWKFSTLFSPVERWAFGKGPPLSEHLKVCPYYELEPRTERVRLPRVREECPTITPCQSPVLIHLLHNKQKARNLS